MPLMVDIRRAVVFAGERGEGLQKTQKLACFADELLVVCEGPVPGPELVLPQGRGSELKENLVLGAERRVPIHPVPAREADLDALVRGCSFVTSDLADEGLNRAIAAAAARWGVLCNIIDTKPLCNTWFMGLVETDNLLAGVSSKGRAAFAASRVRQALEPRFAAWEKQAAFTVRVKGLIVPGKSLEGLTLVWEDPFVRWGLGLLGHRWALARARRRLARAGLWAGG